MNRRVGCLILALLFALLFIFWGMMCRLTLPLSPESPDFRHAVPVPSSHPPDIVIPAKAGIHAPLLKEGWPTHRTSGFPLSRE